jgi:hypothetical protein
MGSCDSQRHRVALGVGLSRSRGSGDWTVPAVTVTLYGTPAAASTARRCRPDRCPRPGQRPADSPLQTGAGGTAAAVLVRRSAFTAGRPRGPPLQWAQFQAGFVSDGAVRFQGDNRRRRTLLAELLVCQAVRDIRLRNPRDTPCAGKRQRRRGCRWLATLVLPNGQLGSTAPAFPSSTARGPRDSKRLSQRAANRRSVPAAGRWRRRSRRQREGRGGGPSSPVRRRWSAGPAGRGPAGGRRR